MIPSLRTFFEYQKYLEPCCSILRRLLNAENSKQSLWRAFSANYFPPEQLQVQTSETTSISLSNVPQETMRALSYMQLWLFCLRNFPEMTATYPRLSPSFGNRGLKRKRPGSNYNQALWNRLGRLAVELGVRTPESKALYEKSPDREHAVQFLRAARPAFKDPSDHLIRAVEEILEGIKESYQPAALPELTTEIDPNWPQGYRCGKPYESDHQQDKDHLFLRLFMNGQPSGRYISTLYGKRDMIFAFFGSRLVDEVHLNMAQTELLKCIDTDGAEEEDDDEFFQPYANTEAHSLKEQQDLISHQQCNSTISTLQARVRELEGQNQYLNTLRQQQSKQLEDASRQNASLKSLKEDLTRQGDSSMGRVHQLERQNEQQSRELQDAAQQNAFLTNLKEDLTRQLASRDEQLVERTKGSQYEPIRRRCWSDREAGELWDTSARVTYDYVDILSQPRPSSPETFYIFLIQPGNTGCYAVRAEVGVKDLDRTVAQAKQQLDQAIFCVVLKEPNTRTISVKIITDEGGGIEACRSAGSGFLISRNHYDDIQRCAQLVASRPIN